MILLDRPSGLSEVERRNRRYRSAYPAERLYHVGVTAALVAILAGCSGHGGGGMMGDSSRMGDHRSGMMSSTTTRPTRAAAGGAIANGRVLFLAAGCGSCHALAAAGTSGTVGPNLDQARPSYTLVVRRVTHGGGQMPPFADSLAPAEIRTIAHFVSSSTR